MADATRMAGELPTACLPWPLECRTSAPEERFMPRLKHYMICGHGRLNYGYTDTHNFEFNDETQPIELAKNVRIIAYIPPGTVFDAISGRQIQKIISGRTLLLSANEGAVDDMRGLLRRKAKLARRNYAAQVAPGTKFFRYTYDGESEAIARYPRLFKAGGLPGKASNDIYDYSLSGPSSAQQKVDFGDFKWGVLSFDSAHATPQHEREFGVAEKVGKLSSLIDTYATDDAVTYFFHLIFCRVEVLDATGLEVVDGGLQTTYLNVISYTGLKEVGGHAWVWD
jgi:hypothetical protein